MEWSPVFDPASIASSAVKRNLGFGRESTPATVRPQSRKRKSPEYEKFSTRIGRKLSDVIEETEHSPYKALALYRSPISGTTSYMSCAPDKKYDESPKGGLDTCILSPRYEISFNKDHFKRSSPYNKSREDTNLSSSLEKCSLDDLYFESQQPKKRKWDHEFLEGKTKSNSAPGTPQHPGEEPENPVRKYRSLDFTPTKGICAKIGTPERNEILYPQLVPVKPVLKPKTPQKLRNELKKLNRPQRKRLFQSRDFVYLFSRVTNHTDIINRVFSYLNDTDLVNVARVSRLWKRTLENDKEAYKRYKRHVKVVTVSKENIYFDTPKKGKMGTSLQLVRKGNIESQKPRSPPGSPTRENWRRFRKAAEGLKRSQSLKKCMICSHPAVVDKGIAQCTKINCGYMWCIQCLLGSKTGPQDFTCRCSDVASPENSPSHDRSGLSDISNVENMSFSFFLPDNSRNLSSHFADNSVNTSTNLSSGYFSQSDVEKSMNTNNIPSGNSKVKSTVLSDYNKNRGGEKLVSDLTNNNLQHNAALWRVKRNLNRKKAVEPDSPEKIKLYAIGSKQSKKNLRRLCF